jgi:hypothetical protein
MLVDDMYKHCRGRHRFDTNPGPTFYLVLIRIQILPQVIYKLENHTLISNFYSQQCHLPCFIFLVSLSILDSILKNFFAKKYSLWFKWIPGSLIVVRIPQFDANLTGSESTTLDEI